jgi:hypothetical protein
MSDNETIHRPRVPGQFTEGDPGLPREWRDLFAENKAVYAAMKILGITSLQQCPKCAQLWANLNDANCRKCGAVMVCVADESSQTAPALTQPDSRQADETQLDPRKYCHLCGRQWHPTNFCTCKGRIQNARSIVSALRDHVTKQPLREPYILQELDRALKAMEAL